MKMMKKQLGVSLGFAALIGLAACSAPVENTESDTAAPSAPTVYNVYVQGTQVGAMEVTETEAGYSVFYEYRNNGRGPTINETISLDAEGIPVAWTATGATTFGNAVDERFELSGDQASWSDSTGDGTATVRDGADAVRAAEWQPLRFSCRRARPAR